MNGLLIFWGFVALLALLEITQMAIRILRGISDKDTRVNDGPWPYVVTTLAGVCLFLAIDGLINELGNDGPWPYMVITPIAVCLYLLIYGLVRDLKN